MNTCLSVEARLDANISPDAACGVAQRRKLHAEHRYDAPFCNCGKSF